MLSTDVNRAFLARAEAGDYREWSFRNTDDSFKATFFTRDGERFRIRPELRAMVRFAPLNLVSDAYPSPATQTVGLDLILCRNVLMYFSPEVCTRVVARLRAALVPGGWLVLGPSDPFPGLMREFEIQNISDAILYRRPERDSPAPRPPAAEVPPGRAARRGGPGTPTPASGASVPERAPAPSSWRRAYQAARASADRGLLAQALEHCQRAVDLAPLRPEPYYLLGTLRDAQGDDRGARQALRQALYVDRAFIPAYLALVACHRRAGRAGEAAQALARARQLLAGRGDTELILPEDGLTAGRLRELLVRAAEESA